MSDKTNFWTKVDVIPSFAVSDTPASMDWFGHLGFQTQSVMRMPDGSIGHAEMARGSFIIMLGPAMECASPGSTGLGLYINLRGASVDAFYEQVKDKVQVPSAPETMFWGDRLFVAEHPDGYKLTFFEHVRDVSEAEMQEAMNQWAAAQAGEPVTA